MTINTETIRDAAEVLDTLTSALAVDHPLRTQAAARAKSCVSGLYSAADAIDAHTAEIDRLRNMAWTNGDILKEAQAEVVKRRGQIIRLRSTLRRLGVGFEAGRDNASRMFEESGSPYHEGRKVAYDQAAADVRAALSGESKC